MRLFLVISVCAMQTACGSVINYYGQFADAQDPCQFKAKPSGYQLPAWCSIGTKTTIYNKHGHVIGYVK